MTENHTDHHATDDRTAHRARRRTTDTNLRRALRRETAGTLALLADEDDFTTMRQYETFAFDDHARYLDHAEDLLHTLTTHGGHTTVALFDPEDYADYCADTALDPDHPASRARYTAERAATGPRVTYTGQPLTTLVPTLIDTAVRRATWEYATTLLAETGPCADCGQDIGRASFDRASQLLLLLLDAAGPGTHHLVCSVPAEGDQLIATLHVTRESTGPARMDSSEGAEFVTVLAAGLALNSPGGLVLRTTTPGDRDRLHGWRLHAGQLRPLTEAQVFDAYCTDARTGEPIAPEPRVDYRPGFLLTPPHDDTHPH
ncbi:hypothetical protein RGF97_29135 [Streptomyces roseicoloratus]|uniref:Uncharacterized protein n=1 Tax=Streptomyces roseicoloratus TaxID=2508722 RepID=A0ABY9S218_9ACTN|nr:hypothetical protein [Streptomyces roseicoloratus]WMX48064.1 hypothetical protein RGF97_29135 [Streptomyces roseicoloratus]